MPNLNPDIGFLGASYGFGQKKLGVELGPQLLRTNGLKNQLERNSNEVKDFKNIYQNHQLSPGEMFYDLFQKTLDMAFSCKQSIIIGGDHSISIATIAALLEVQPDLAVIWVDAHGDMNTPKTSPSGNLHGMPLAHLLGLVDPSHIKNMEWYPAKLHPQKLALVGVRDLDRGEKEIIKHLGIKTVTADEVHLRGMKLVMNEVLQCIDPQNNRPLHLSFDIDSVDPSFAKATGLHVPNGLDVKQIKTLGQFLKATGRLTSAEFVEINPLMAKTEAELQSTVSVVFELINEIFVKNQSTKIPLVKPPIDSRAKTWPFFT